jgi:hypothetical protein
MAQETIPGGAYDVPNINDVSTAQEADAALNKINSAWLIDNRHPYSDPNHPQHQEFVDTVNKLYRIKFGDDVDDTKTPVQKAMRQAMQDQKTEQNDLAYEVQDTLDELNRDFDFGDVDVQVMVADSGPIIAEEKDLLGILHQVKSGQFDGADGAVYKLKRWLEKLPAAPSAIRECLAEVPKLETQAEKEEFIGPVMRWIWAYERQRRGLKPRRPVKGE